MMLYIKPIEPTPNQKGIYVGDKNFNIFVPYDVPANPSLLAGTKGVVFKQDADATYEYAIVARSSTTGAPAIVKFSDGSYARWGGSTTRPVVFAPETRMESYDNYLYVMDGTLYCFLNGPQPTSKNGLIPYSDIRTGWKRVTAERDWSAAQRNGNIYRVNSTIAPTGTSEDPILLKDGSGNCDLLASVDTNDGIWLYVRRGAESDALCSVKQGLGEVDAPYVISNSLGKVYAIYGISNRYEAAMVLHDPKPWYNKDGAYVHTTYSATSFAGGSYWTEKIDNVWHPAPIVTSYGSGWLAVGGGTGSPNRSGQCTYGIKEDHKLYIMRQNGSVELHDSGYWTAIYGSSYYLMYTIGLRDGAICTIAEGGAIKEMPLPGYQITEICSFCVSSEFNGIAVAREQSTGYCYLVGISKEAVVLGQFLGDTDTFVRGMGGYAERSSSPSYPLGKASALIEIGTHQYAYTYIPCESDNRVPQPGQKGIVIHGQESMQTSSNYSKRPIGVPSGCVWDDALDHSKSEYNFVYGSAPSINFGAIDGISCVSFVKAGLAITDSTIVNALPSLSSPFTWSIWVYNPINYSESKAIRNIIDLERSPYNAVSKISFKIYDDKSYADVDGYRAEVALTFGYNVPRWRHFCFTRDSENILKQYIDGELRATANASFANSNPVEQLCLHSYTSSMSWQFYASENSTSLASGRIFNRALKPGEVLGLASEWYRPVVVHKNDIFIAIAEPEPEPVIPTDYVFYAPLAERKNNAETGQSLNYSGSISAETALKAMLERQKAEVEAIYVEQVCEDSSFSALGL